MPSRVTEPIHSGESLSFPEFAARTARAVGPWVAYERDFPIDAPLPDHFEPFNGFDEKRFREVSTELGQVAMWTQEEAGAQAHQSNLARLKAALQIRHDGRQQLRRYRHMTAQVAAWEAPTEEHEGMRRAMQSQLDETFKFAEDSSRHPTPEKETGPEYQERRMRELAEEVLRITDRLDISSAQLEQSSVYAKEFKDSLEGWEDVPVPPVRQLP